MYSYKQYLYEARKNPKLNPKIDTNKALLKYKGRDVYVSFRSINKLGINPHSRYSTPNGIYGYPLEDYISKLEANVNIKDVFPYMGDEPEEHIKKHLGADINVVDNVNPYIYVFKPKSDKNIIRLGDVTKPFVIDFIAKAISKDKQIRMHFVEPPKDIKKLEIKIHEINDLLSASDYDDLREIYLGFSINGANIENQPILKKVRDILWDGTGEDDELYNKAIKELQLELKNDKEKLNTLKTNSPNYGDNKEFAEHIYTKAEPRVKTPGGRLWWFAWELFQDNINQWNKFYRDMGVDGIVDNEGEGIIHSNEPYQVVFFDKTKLEILESILVKSYNPKIRIGDKSFEYKLDENGNRVFSNIFINSSSESYKSIIKTIFKESDIVTGDFYIIQMGLETLEGLPQTIGRVFNCSNNQLTNLEGAPANVVGGFDCGNNKLTSLEGAPTNVGGSFYCNDNELTNLEGAPTNIGGSFYCSYNDLTSLEGAPKVVGGDFICRNNIKKFTVEEIRAVCDVKGKIAAE